MSLERQEVIEDIRKHIEADGYSSTGLALAEVMVLLGEAAHASRTDGRAIIYDKLTLLASGVARWMEDLAPLVKPGKLEELRELGTAVEAPKPSVPTSEYASTLAAWSETVDLVVTSLSQSLFDMGYAPPADLIHDAVQRALRKALSGAQS